MELIQNWTLQDKEALKQFLIENIEGEYDDITIVGSRVLGGFHPKSDMDVIVWTDELKDHHTCFFTGVDNPENPYKNIKCVIQYRNVCDKENNFWSKYNYSMSDYSIINDVFHKRNDNHYEHHKRLRQLILDTGGLNVPFKKFEEENAYLL